MSDCPDQQTLRNLVHGRLKAGEQKQVSNHCRDCHPCMTAMKRLIKEGGGMAVAVQSKPTEQPVKKSSPAYQPTVIGAASPTDDAQPQKTVIGQIDANDPSALAAGSELGVYRIETKLGEGGMGSVYKAVHKKLKRTVALKLLAAHRLTPEDVARFEREMVAAGQVSHPNIVTAFDAGEADGKHFLAMELVDGFDLSQICMACSPMDIGSASELIRQAAIGLQHAHEHGMVHRDIKPSNLMLTKKGRVKILDLGLARVQSEIDQSELTGTGQLMGTIDYMAAEQGSDSHNVDIRADIYSLGVTLHKLLTGVVPYTGTYMEKLMALANSDAAPIQSRRSDLPDELAAIVDKMMQRNPTSRFSEPKQVAKALKPFSDHSSLKQVLKTTANAGKVGTQAKQNTIKSSNAAIGTDPNRRLKISQPAAEVTHIPTINVVDSGARTRVKNRREQRMDQKRKLQDRKPQKRTAVAGWKKPVFVSLGIVGVAALAAMMFLPDQRVTVETKAGKIVVETQGKETEISIKGETVSFNDPSDNKPVTVSVDYKQNQLTFTKDGFAAVTRKVDLTSKDGDKVSIRFEPKALATADSTLAVVPNAGSDSAKQMPDFPRAESREAQKEVMDWAFKNGLQQVTGLAGGQAFKMRQATDFPVDRIESFRSVDLNPEKMSTGVLARINSVKDVERLTFSISLTCPEHAIRQIGQLPALVDLGIYCSYFSTKPFERLPASICHRLTAFNAPNLQVRDPDVAEIVRLFPNLKEIELRGTHLTGLAGTYLKELPLTEISFRAGNTEMQSSLGDLTLVTMATFGRQELHDFSHLPPNLETLICTGAKIERTHFDYLIKYESLKDISLQSSSVNEADESAFRTARPDCKLGVSRRSTATASDPASMSNIQTIDWAFKNGVVYLSVTAGGKAFPYLRDTSELGNRKIEKIGFVQLNTSPKTPEVLERLNSISPVTYLTIWGSDPLEDQVVQQLAKLQSLDRLGFYCQFDIDQLEQLPESFRRQLSFLLLRKDNRQTPITDQIVAKAVKLFPNLSDFDTDCSNLSTTATISTLRTLPLLTAISLSDPKADLQHELESLTKVTNFRYLDMTATAVSAIPCNAELFWCDGFKLTEKDFKVLAQYKSLKTIISRFAEVDRDAIAAFKVIRPNCTVRIESPLPSSTGRSGKTLSQTTARRASGSLVKPISATVSNDDGGSSADRLMSNETITDRNYDTIAPSSDGYKWFTSDRNGGMGTDYFDKNGIHTNVSLEFKLAKVEQLTGVVIWGYAYEGAEHNDVKDFELQFSNDGGKTFSSPIEFTKAVYEPSKYSQTIPLGRTVQANVVRMTITDNHYTAGTPGGDRVGLDEVRFLKAGKGASSR